MTNTRMDSRVEALEKNQDEIRAELTALNSKFAAMETSIAKLAAMETSMAKISNLLALTLQTKGQGDASASSTAPPQMESNPHVENSAPSPIQQVYPNSTSVFSGKIEIPTFDGTDPIGWLARAEQFFAIHLTREDLKVHTAFISMEGPALHWLRWLQQQYPTLTWRQFTAELLEEFGGELTGPPIEQLAALRQTGTIDEYANIFRARVAQIPGLAPQIQLGLFLNGLKPTIRVRLRPNDVMDLRTAMRVARAVERELEFLDTGCISRQNIVEVEGHNDSFTKKSSISAIRGTTGLLTQSPTHSLSTVHHQSRSVSAHPHHSDKNSSSSFDSQSRPSPIPHNSSSSSAQKIARHYTNQEYLDMRAKGLCFRCQQPYSPLHVCPNNSLRTLIAGEDEDGDDGTNDSGGYRFIDGDPS